METIEFAPIIKRIQDYRKVQLSRHASAFIKIKLNNNELEQLVVELSKVLSNDFVLPIFSLDGRDVNTSFESIKKAPEKIEVPNVGNRSVRKLIFSEDKPFILLIHSFKQMKGNDQAGFARLEDKINDPDRIPWKIHEGSIIIAGIEDTGSSVDIHAGDRGIYLYPPFTTCTE